ncbi:hypothetical protein, unlikely [Trypanosoma brucei brucei TREU927]|uniref:Uncharacterized protein n=1 Tax=Trypanosoma brucei brucei (strain 927/4 GUTat10.1) TaxID=185431 RepID=Q38FY9_TRYB2|nr:hypothetical protein, unlikely [Trypanosoma brucei brucei TREU927]EAN76281.1 hypothetical protein, unlikely [Trypanosoma brucei brucei TREU927]
MTVNYRKRGKKPYPGEGGQTGAMRGLCVLSICVIIYYYYYFLSRRCHFVANFQVMQTFQCKIRLLYSLSCWNRWSVIGLCEFRLCYATLENAHDISKKKDGGYLCHTLSFVKGYRLGFLFFLFLSVSINLSFINYSCLGCLLCILSRGKGRVSVKRVVSFGLCRCRVVNL